MPSAVLGVRGGKTDDVAEDLTEALVLESGGWHPRYARVVLLIEEGTVAVAIVDGNGDGAELELEHWTVVGDEWQCELSGGLGALDEPGSWESGWASGVGYAVGREVPGATIEVEWRHERKQVRANEVGLWACIFPHADPPGGAQWSPVADGWETTRQDSPRRVGAS